MPGAGTCKNNVWRYRRDSTEALMTVADQALCRGCRPRTHPNGRKQFPAYNPQTCYTCQKVRHVAKFCRRRLNQCRQSGGRSARSKGAHSLTYISNIKDHYIRTDLITISIMSPIGSIKTACVARLVGRHLSGWRRNPTQAERARREPATVPSNTLWHYAQTL